MLTTTEMLRNSVNSPHNRILQLFRSVDVDSSKWPARLLEIIGYGVKWLKILNEICSRLESKFIILKPLSCSLDFSCYTYQFPKAIPLREASTITDKLSYQIQNLQNWLRFISSGYISSHDANCDNDLISHEL